jgi:hypothetical protein
VITALAEAAPAVASDLASVVHAIAGARSQAGYRLLLDGGAVQALLRQLPHEDSSVKVAEALAKLAQTDDGQDELIRAKAAPQLLAASLEAAEDAAAADAVRALARLAVHADGRAQLSKLAELAPKGERALRLLAIAIATSSVCARAVAEPAMRMIEAALASRRPPSTAMLKLLHAVVASGELKQREQIANDAALEAIASAVEGEDPYGIALHSLVDLIAKVDEARSKVLRLNLPERILLRTLDADSGHQRWQAINLVMILSRSEDGAAAVVRVDGVVARLARLATDQRDYGQASHADEQLATLLGKLADAATAQAARNAAADERFEPLLRLQPESKALKALVRSDRAVREPAGRSRTCSQPTWAARPSASCSLGFSSRATRKSAPSPRTWASGWSTWCSAMGSSPSTALGSWFTSAITQMRSSSSSSWSLQRHSFPPWSRTWTRTMWRRSRRPFCG